jgi:hypothetical protein
MSDASTGLLRRLAEYQRIRATWKVRRHVRRVIAPSWASSSVNRDQCSSGNRVGYVASIFMEQRNRGMLDAVRRIAEQTVCFSALGRSKEKTYTI